MQVSNPNNIKIYNLSAGRSLPEWLSDRKKRALQKQDGDLRKRIELIQDFEMPGVSNFVDITRDQQYIFACGVYKPRIRCFDVNNLSMKFERCYDAEAVKFHVLSDDYTKLVILQNDRYVEFHSQNGKWYRTRIPKYGRDMDFHQSSCDMYFVGASSEIYRLNLERGSFMQSLKTEANEILCCEFNPEHELFTYGTREGRLECWDPRSKSRAGTLDCAPHVLEADCDVSGVPAISSLKYRNALHFGVGTRTGQILLYDLRSSKPLLVKDHNYGLPIKTVRFHEEAGLVLSLDQRILKMWERETGKPFTSIEPESKLNHLCMFPESGLLFIANEAPKILTYYLPALGAAPRWCSFLDSLTEELEEDAEAAVYDDYKFVTRTELESLGMSNLVGTNLLRAYMHGYFMDVRLYHKAKSVAEPFAYAEYRKNKIREKIEEQRKSRVQVKKLPKVNRALAEKLAAQSEGGTEDTKIKRKQREAATNLLQDSRFAAMFERPEFQVDTESEEYQMLNPLVSKMDKARQKSAKKLEAAEVEAAARDSDAEADSDSESSDDEHTWKLELKQRHREIQRERRLKRREEALLQRRAPDEPSFREVSRDAGGGSQNAGAAGDLREKRRAKKKTLGERLAAMEDSSDVLRQSGSAAGSMEMTFQLRKFKKDAASKPAREDARAEHHRERRKLRRSAGNLSSKRGRGRGGFGGRR